MPNKSAKMRNRRKNRKGNTNTPQSVSPRDSNNGSKTYTTVVSTQSKIGGDQEMIKEAKDALAIALQDEDLRIEDVRGEIAVGNPSGVYLAWRSEQVPEVEDKLALVKTELKIQEVKLETHQAELKTQRAELTTQRADLTELFNANRRLASTAMQSEYSQVRNRFISVFKRDKLKAANKLDYKIIDKGNMPPHGADALTDAELYTSLDLRSDTATFEILYGLHPERVSGTEHTGSIITALNIHARIISSPTKVATKKFYDSFSHFINLLKQFDYDESYLELWKSNILKTAYVAFLDCSKSEVHKVEQA